MKLLFDHQKRGLPRWITLIGCCVLLSWTCLRLYDYQHAAARGARGLWSLQPTERLAAVRELEGSGRVDPDVAIPALIRALQDTNPEVRATAAMALVSAVPGVRGGAVPTAEDISAAVRALVKALDDSQSSVRAAVTRALWMVILVNQVPEEQIELVPAANALVGQLDDSDPAVRLSAVQGIGAVGPNLLGDPPPRLVAALDDETEKTRDAAALALGAFHHGLPVLIPALVQSAEKAAPAARPAYLKLLSQIRAPKFSGDAVPGLIAALTSADGKIVAVAADDLLAFADQNRPPIRFEARSAVRPLIDSLERLIGRVDDDPVTPDPVVAIALALGGLAPNSPSNDEAAAGLAKVLRAGNTNRRVAAAKALSRFQPHAAIFASLTSLIGETDRPVRLAVLKAIHDVDFGDSFVAPSILSAALEDESPEVRAAAAAASGHAGRGVDSYIPALLHHAVRDPDAQVRAMCAVVLSGLSPVQLTTAVLPHLITALDAPDSAFQDMVSRILISFGRAATPAVPALVRILKEAETASNDMRAIVSAQILAKIGSQDVAANAIRTLRTIADHGDERSRSRAKNTLRALKVGD
jgi:HEAT repeat protein